MTDTETLTLRPAAADDVATIHRMLTALARATAASDRFVSRPEDIARYGFGDEALFHSLLAERGGEAVGLCLYFYTFSTWLGEPGIYVQDLYVADSARGGGVGRALLGAAARQGRRRQATHLRLSVDRQNAGARRFYERIGMDYRDQECTYHVGGAAYAALAERPA